MNGEKKKDALTELVDIVGSSTEQKPNNGVVSTPTGESVKLGFDSYIREVAKKIVSIIKKRKNQEKEVREYLVIKDHKQSHERTKTN